MSRSALLLLVVSLGALAQLTAAFGSHAATADDRSTRDLLASLRLGRVPEADLATPNRIRDALGQPRHLSRQILYRRYYEQWWYEQPVAVRLDFDYPAGQQPRLLSVTLQPVKP